MAEDGDCAVIGAEASAQPMTAQAAVQFRARGVGVRELAHHPEQIDQQQQRPDGAPQRSLVAAGKIRPGWCHFRIA